MKRPMTAALVAALVLVAACGDSDDGEDAAPTTTSGTATTGGTATTAPEVTDPVDILFGPVSTSAVPDPLECSMKAGVIVGRKGAQPDPELATPLEEVDEESELDITQAEVDRLAADPSDFQIFVLTDPATNPLDVARESVDLSPVYVYGFGGHVVFIPASGARPETAGPTALPYAAPGEGLLGIVDSGLDRRFQLDGVDAVGPNGDPYLDPSLDRDVDVDVSDPSWPAAGHGTFIASLVRQLPGAPEVVMTAARLGEHTVTDGVVANGQKVSGTTAGWSVYAAIVRLADALEQREAIGAPLSLSLVTEKCEGEDAFLLDAALQYWRDKEPQLGPIFAGAGNGSDSSQMEPALYPGASPDVTAVGAVGWNGRRADFSNEGEQWAPGVCLVADRGPSFGGVSAWSGTSFATPLAAAGNSDEYEPLGQQMGRRLDEATRGECGAEEDDQEPLHLPPTTTSPTTSSPSSTTEPPTEEGGEDG